MRKRTNWTPEMDARLIEMYSKNTPASACAKLFGVSIDAIYKRAQRLSITDCERQQYAVKTCSNEGSVSSLAYAAGQRYREKGYGKDAAPTRDAFYRAWWLGGWHDKDMAMGNSVIGEVA